MRYYILPIKHQDQDYDTVGNYQKIGDTTIITVSDTGDRKYNFLLMIHEMVEAFLTEEHGINWKDITEFDVSNPELDEPGGSPNAPYQLEHLSATGIESAVAKELKVDWDKYEDRLKEICK